MRTPWVPPPALPLGVVAVRPATLRRSSLAGGSVLPQAFPRVRFSFGGFLPLPTRYRIHFGEPLRFQGDPDDEDAVIEEKVAVVRATVQSMVNRGLKERPAIFW